MQTWMSILWPAFLLAGIERVTIAPGDTAFTPLRFDHYPWSHSLVLVMVWACVAGAIVWWRGRAVRPVLLAGLLVVSHWVLDLLVHRPDLPLYPGGPNFGLGLWNSVPATLVLEAVVFVGGLMIYLKGTRARDRQGAIAFWSFVVLVSLLYLASTFGPAPGDARAIAWGALGQWIIVPWGWWIDLHRTVIDPATFQAEPGEAGSGKREADKP